jgi:hypothetical protein
MWEVAILALPANGGGGGGGGWIKKFIAKAAKKTGYYLKNTNYNWN